MISQSIRNRGTTFSYKLKFRIRDDQGALFPNLKIRDLKTNSYIDLNLYKTPLVNYNEFNSSDGYLMGENTGWELNMPFKNKEELVNLVNLFLKKSSVNIFDKKGRPLKETKTQRRVRSHWQDSYETPVLIIGRKAIEFYSHLPNFIKATKVVLKEKNNEISFIINKKLEMLKNSGYYNQLLKFGFIEEVCLGNKPFVVEFVDK